MRTIFWEDERVMMIDQRKLPHALVVNRYDDSTAVAEAIRTMVIRGAPALGAAGAFGMALTALHSGAHDRQSLLSELEAAAKVLSAARPTAVNLSWAVERMWRVATDEELTTVDEVRRALID